MVWVSDDDGDDDVFLFEAVTPVDSFDGEELNTHDGLGSVHCNLLCSWGFELPNQAVMQAVNMFATVHLYTFKRVFVDVLNLLYPQVELLRVQRGE